jgi:hypothetical protein
MNRHQRRAQRGHVIAAPVKIGRPGPNGIAIDPHGTRIAVIRPAEPKLAMAMAEVALKHNDKALFERMPEEVKDYTFAGWLSAPSRSRPQCIVDEQGHKIGELVAGDSLVSLQNDSGVTS